MMIDFTPQIFETERLRLFKLEQEDYRYLLETLTPDQSCSLTGWTAADYQLALERWKQGMCTYNRCFCWFRMQRKEDGAWIGQAGYHQWMPEHRRAELGYALDKTDYYGQGYMREALNWLIPYGFKQMNLHRIEAFISPFNLASLALVKRWGFQQEGHLRQHYCKDGCLEDSLVFGLLRDELPATFFA